MWQKKKKTEGVLLPSVIILKVIISLTRTILKSLNTKNKVFKDGLIFPQNLC